MPLHTQDGQDGQDDPCRKLDSLIEMALGGDAQPLGDYISQNDSNKEWREMAIAYLIKTCGLMWERVSMEKIWAINLLSRFDNPKQSEDIIAFFELKWTEFCNMKIKPTPSNQDIMAIAAASGHGLLAILANLHSEKAIEYLEQILAACQSDKNGNRHFALAAAEFLALAKRHAALKSGKKN